VFLWEFEMGRSKQISAEVAASLARGSPHPEATPSDWKRLIADIKKKFHGAINEQQKALLQEEYKAAQLGLRAAGQASASKSTFVTGTNLSALVRMVIENGGPVFPSRMHAVDLPHIKRCLAAGLIEVVGDKARLTAAGREAVGDALIHDIDREQRWTPRENTFVSSPEKRAELLAKDVTEHNAKIQRLEQALAKIVEK
jgi:hypothetical protein